MERALKPFDSPEVFSFNPKRVEEMQDALFLLKCIVARKRGDEIPPETVIGYERD